MIRKLIALVAFITLLQAPAWAVTVIDCELCTQDSTTNVTCPKPTGLSVGQLLVVMPIQTGTGPMTSPAGWTNPEGSSGYNGICGDTNSGGSAFAYTAWKQATSADVSGGPYVFTFASGFGSGGAICAYDYVNYVGGTPYDPSGSPQCTANGTGSTNSVAPSITTTYNNTQAILFYDSGLSSGASTFTGPVGATQRVINHDGVYKNVWMGDYTQVTAGATGAQTATQTQSVESNALQFGIQTGPKAGNAFFWPFP